MFPVLSAAPVPLIGVLMTSFPLAFSAGIETLGALPKAPDTLTAPFGLAAAGDPDEPQPARTAQAASGTSSAAAMRRM